MSVTDTPPTDPAADVPPDLAAYAARLLVGTDLTTHRAALTAAGHGPGTGPVATALRDGWATAEHPPALPAPPVEPSPPNPASTLSENTQAHPVRTP